MEDSWENWHLHSELNIMDDEGDDFLKEILLQQPPLLQAFSSETENDCYNYNYNNSVHVQNDTVSAISNSNINVLATNDTVSAISNSNINVLATNGTNSSKTTGHNSCSSSKKFILSFDNSTMIPATPETCVDYGQPVGKRDSRGSSSKRSLESESKNKSTAVKKARSGSETMLHIMAERKRRQELTQKFIALSAMIPGLSKALRKEPLTVYGDGKQTRSFQYVSDLIDKASVLGAAIDYVKHLQERVEELEKHDKEDATSSVIVIKKPGGNNNNIEVIKTSSETSHDYCNNNMINILPEIQARAMGKEVLIEILCAKEIGIDLKLFTHVENLQLFVTRSSVLPFGNSTLFITIIAETGKEYKLTVTDLVKSLRQKVFTSQ